MDQKNYYSILKVKKHASFIEIKKAYHKLAMIFHPDKNREDAMAEEVFKEINEAYNILSDKNKRSSYDKKYFQQYSFSSKDKAREISPDDILNDAIQLREKLLQQNIFSVNYDALHFQLQQILSAENIFILKEKNEQAINEKLIGIILECCKPLPVKLSVEITNLAIPLSLSNHLLMQEIMSFQKTQKSNSLWEKNKIIIAFIAALLVCMLIRIIFK